MIVYAIFFCMQIASTGSCQMANTQIGRLDTLGPLRGTPYYSSLASCEKALKPYVYSYPKPIRPDSQGRYMIAPGEWYECLHRRIDTWQ